MPAVHSKEQDEEFRVQDDAIRRRLLQGGHVLRRYFGWGAMMENGDDLSRAVIRGCAHLYRILMEHFPWLNSYKPRIIKAFEKRPLKTVLPVYMVGMMIGMLYVGYVHFFLPAAGVTGFFTGSNLGFHSLLALTCISYYQALVTDPGGIPEEWEQLPEIYLLEKKKSEQGAPRYCNKEKVYKPDRAHFCSAMGRNVLRMDHYCPWLSNCVGYFNHKFFFLFLFYASICSNWVAFSLTTSKILGKKALMNAGYQFFVAESQGLSVLISVIITPFFGFHCWLAGKNLTTIEFCEKKTANGGFSSPYDLHCYHNYKTVLGKNPLYWLIPIDHGLGDGITWEIREDVKRRIEAINNEGDPEWSAGGNRRNNENSAISNNICSDRGCWSDVWSDMVMGCEQTVETMSSMSEKFWDMCSSATLLPRVTM